MSATITAQDVKDIRNSYGLSQKSFALLLGIGPASIVRYEQGATPSKANANLIRAARNPQFMKECLESDGDLIPEYQRVRAESVIYDYVSLDPAEDARMHEGLDPGPKPALSMDEMYHYTLQQEILNEQAANLIADLINRKRQEISRGLDASASDALLHQLSALKPDIVSSNTLDDVKLANIRGQLEAIGAFVKRQQAEVA